MSTQTQTRQMPVAAAATNGSLVRKFSEEFLVKTHEYTPLGQAEKISLSIASVRLALNPRTRSGREAPPDQMLKFILLCKARALNPFEGDAYFLGYEGKDGEPDQWSIITSIYAFLKRAEINPQYDGMESGVIVQKSNGEVEEREGDFLFPFETSGEMLLGGWAKVYRKDRRVPTYKRVSLSTFSTAKSRWKDDAAGMICKVAEVHALRDTFPTTLGSLYIQDEMPEHQTIDLGTLPSTPALPTKRGKIAAPKAEVTPAPEPEPPANQEADEPQPLIDDDEKADLAAQEAQEAAYDASTFNPETATKEELIAAIKPHLERLKKKESWLCTRVGLSQRELGQCTEAGLRAAYRDVASVKSV